MKKVLLVLMMLATTLTFAQEKQNTVAKTLEETVQPYVQKLLNGLEQGVEFATTEIPVVLKQYILYQATTSWLLVVLGVLMVSIIFKKLTRYIEKIDDDWQTPLPIVPYLSFIGGIIMFFLNIGTAIKATFFPKLYLVEKFIQLI